MIKVNVLRDQEHHIKEFKVTGHAYAAEAGKDIVCAAISALTQTTILGLCEVLKIQASYKISEGYLECKLPDDLTEEKQLQAHNLLETMVLGIKNIQESYSKYIIVHDKEV